MATGTLYTISTEGWWSDGTTTGDITSISIEGWFTGAPTGVVPSDETAGQFGDFFFRVPSERAKPEEIRRAFQDCQRLMNRITSFLSECGTAFPADPGEGKLFYKVDEGILYVYCESEGGWIPAFTGGTVPTTQDFLLMSGENFELMSGETFELVEAGT